MHILTLGFIYFHFITMHISVQKDGRALIAALLAILISVPFLVEAVTATDSVVVTQVVTPGISISAPADITLTPLSTTQNTAVGSATWTVTTNNAAGYTLALSASTTPALQGTGGRQFTDLGATPATWAVTSAYKFGFSAYGTDAPTATWGTDTDCLAGANVPSTTLKWRGFNGTTGIQVASSSAVTGTSGTATTMCVGTEQNGVFAPSDTYTATITATATTS